MSERLWDLGNGYLHLQLQRWHPISFVGVSSTVIEYDINVEERISFISRADHGLRPISLSFALLIRHVY